MILKAQNQICIIVATHNTLSSIAKVLKDNTISGPHLRLDPTAFADQERELRVQSLQIFVILLHERPETIQNPLHTQSKTLKMVYRIRRSHRFWFDQKTKEGRWRETWWKR